MSNVQLLVQDLTFEQFISRLHAQEVQFATPTSENSVATPDRTRLPHTAS